MGIRGLGRFLSEAAPEAIRQQDFKAFLGQEIAIDASMSLYQFMIAIRDGENFGSLVNEAGEATSHISGFLSRCVRLLENGIKPVYVFDGKPTDLKLAELEKRKERRVKAHDELEAARDIGDTEGIKKFMGRTVRITQQHNDDVKELLRLMGVPVVEAPSEAEAQCAHMAAAGLVYATATEDADALTFGTPVLIRHLNFSDQNSKGKPILVFSLKTILEALELTMEQFVDFCILCGCDYCDRLKGIGPQTAYKLIKKHNNIEGVLHALDDKKPLADVNDYNYVQARAFFLSPEVLSPAEVPKLVWKEPQEEKLRAFLVEKHNFNPKRVESYLARLRAARGKSSQTRLDAFFGPATVKKPAAPTKTLQNGKNKRKITGSATAKTSISIKRAK